MSDTTKVKERKDIEKSLRVHSRTLAEQNFKAFLKICPDITKIKEHRKSKAEGYMDLGLDILKNQDNIIRFALSHYYKHDSGDMIADPDMEMIINFKTQTLNAVTYQDAFGYQTAESTTPFAFSPTAVQRFNEFVKMWLKNLRSQGHSFK